MEDVTLKNTKGTINVKIKLRNICPKGSSTLASGPRTSPRIPPTIIEEKMNMIRLNKKDIPSLKQTLDDLEETSEDNSFGNEILKNSLFIQLMVKINRLFLGMDIKKKLEDVKYDPRIENILSFINDKLDQELSIDMISNKFYLNKYYLMHLFKRETGYTLYNYIQKKRIIKASEYIRKGMQAGDVCSLCGFGDYSTFVRSFKKEFNLSPKQYYKAYQNSSIIEQ